jgi:hypothetical protein
MSIYFQGVRGWSAAKAGVTSIPIIFGMAISCVLSGSIATWIGYYYPLLYAITTLLAPITAGLLTTLDIDTNLAKSLCYQALLGFAVGLGIQAPQLVAQTLLAPKEATNGIAIVSFGS